MTANVMSGSAEAVTSPPGVGRKTRSSRPVSLVDPLGDDTP